MEMELAHVEAFVAIVRSGGFTQASAAVHLTQPAISRRIALLERELGAPLFERLPQGPVLTEAGAAFLPHAEALLAVVRDGIEAVGDVRGSGSGSIALAVVGTLATSALAERLRRFRAAHPGVDLRLRTALSAEVSALVLRGEAAVGLRYTADPNPGMVSTIVTVEALVPVCSARHRLAGASQVRPEDLACERWVAFPAPAGGVREPYATAIEQRLAATGIVPAEIVPIDSLTAQKRMVEAEFGLALLPESGVREELDAGTLALLPIPGLHASIPVALIHRRGAFQGGATRALLAELAAWSPPLAV
jgi:DNA-binding transcriptional LysR family regulator